MPLFAKGWFGGGDAKLCIALGATLGLLPFLVFFAATCVAGGAFALRARRVEESEIAYAPVMLVGLLLLIPLKVARLMSFRGGRIVLSSAGGRDTPTSKWGGVAVEFALIAFALYLIIAGMLSFGRWMAVQQAAQDVARFAAREVALYPLPAETDSLDAALADTGFRAAVYDPDFLVVNLDALAAGQTLDDVFAAMPVVNRALRPLMIFSTVETPEGLLRLLHVPGRSSTRTSSRGRPASRRR